MDHESINILRFCLGDDFQKLWVVEQCRTPDTLPNLLHRTLGSVSSEPRNKIYALFGLLKAESDPSKSPPFEIDYTVSLASLYRDVTKWCISQQGQSLNFYLELASTAHRTPGLPSWAVDWSIPRKERHLWSSRIRAVDLGSAQTNEITHIRSLDQVGDPNHLFVNGAWVDLIAHTGDPSLLDSELSMLGALDILFSIIRSWQDMVVEENIMKKIVRGDHEDIPDVFFRTLLAYMAWNSYPVQREYGRQHYLEMCGYIELRKLQALVPEQEFPTARYMPEKWDDVLRRACSKRRMCETASGRLAMCPAGTESGDIAVQLGQTEYIYVLRPRDSNFSLIGMAYIYGRY